MEEMVQNNCEISKKGASRTFHMLLTRRSLQQEGGGRFEAYDIIRKKHVLTLLCAHLAKAWY